MRGSDSSCGGISTGGPLKPAFGLSGAVQGWKAPSGRSCFCVVYSDSTFTVFHSRMLAHTAGPSTPQVIAFAMIFSGRDDRVGGIGHPHSSQNRA